MSNESAATIDQITETVGKVKPLSRVSIYANLKALGIKPLGARQIPQLYPPDTATRILQRYGLAAK